MPEPGGLLCARCLLEHHRAGWLAVEEVPAALTAVAGEALCGPHALDRLQAGAGSAAPGRTGPDRRPDYLELR